MYEQEIFSKSLSLEQRKKSKTKHNIYRPVEAAYQVSILSWAHIEENEWIEDEGSVSWFDEQFTELGYKVVDYGDYFKNARKKVWFTGKI